MASMDVFHSDPFRTIQLTLAIEKVPYVPDGLEAMGIFDDDPIRTEDLMIEERDGVLNIIPISDRGAPATQRTTELRSARAFKVPRLKMEDTIKAREIAGIRAFGSETELMQVQDEVARRLVGPTGIRNNLRYTQEYHRLGAVQGIVLDANGSTVYNWFNEFGITPNTEIAFSLAAKTTGSLRPICNQMTRTMKRNARGAFVPSTRVTALCGDAFWDSFITHPDVEKTYLNWKEATELRNGTAFQSMTFADIDWTNYRGSDNVIALTGTATATSGTITMGSTSGLAVGMAVSGPGIPSGVTISGISTNTSVSVTGGTPNTTVTAVFNFGGAIEIPSNKVQFFPAKAPGVFKRALAPADSFEWVNTLGKPEYVQMIPDLLRNEWIKTELSVYPLHICTRPEVLFTGTMDNTAD